MGINVKSVKSVVGKFAISLLIVFCISNSVKGQWLQTNGPLYGYVRSFVTLGDTLYCIARFGGEIYRSTDHGVNWTKITTPFDSVQTFDLLIRGTTIFASTPSGTHRSRDGGKVWEDNPYPFFKLAQNTKYIFGVVGNSLYRSSNEGDSWILSDSRDLLNTSVNILSANDTEIIAGTDKGIFRSKDVGHSWLQTDTLAKSQIINMIKFIGDALFASGNGLFRSTDGDSNWVLLNDSIKALDMIRFGNSLLVVGYNGIFRSDDNGLHWVQANNGLHDLNVRSITEFSGNLLVGTFTDWIYRSTDSGNTWSRMNGGIREPATINLTSNGKSLFSGTDVGVYRSTNEGNTWIPENSGMGDQYTTGFAVKDTFLFRGGGYYFGRSSNNGDTWVTSGAPWITILWVNDSSIFAPDGQNIIRSTDNGKNWQKCFVDSSLNNGFGINAFAAVGDILFAGGNWREGNFFRSINGGINWAMLNKSNFDSADVLSLYTISDTLIAGTSTKGIFRSTDLGDHWQVSNTGGLKKGVTSFASNGKFIFAGTSSTGVLVSTDNGLNWNQFNESLVNKYVKCLLVYNEFLYAGISGSGVWKRPLSDLSVPLSENSINLILAPSVPNPFNSETRIFFTCAKSMTLYLDIFDLLGNKLYSDSKFSELGNNSWVIYDRSLPRGTLYARISDGFGEVKTLKLEHEK